MRRARTIKQKGARQRDQNFIVALPEKLAAVEKTVQVVRIVEVDKPVEVAAGREFIVVEKLVEVETIQEDIQRLEAKLDDKTEGCEQSMKNYEELVAERMQRSDQ